MKKYLLILLFNPISLLLAQNEKLTTKINLLSVQEKLRNATKEISISVAKNQAENNGIELELPMADGSYVSFKVIESPLMSDELAKRFPEIKTYRAFGSNDNESSGLFTVAPSGVYGLFFTTKGNVIIAPKDILQNEHEVFYQNDLLTDGQCEIRDEHINTFGKNLKAKAIQSYSNGATLRTYRMAIVTTGEFFTNNGSSQVTAQAAVVSMVNSIRAVYEKEASVTFSLVSTKIYDDGNTDPFNPSGASKALDAALAFGTLASSEPASFALGLYDIGHVIHHSPGGGGVAYLSSPCRNDNLNENTSPIKAGGWSGGTTTSFTTFIHEVGHQFSAGHTFNSVNSGCNGNIMTASAFEPGSGSTFMSYWGNCSPDNISGSVNRTYFHTNSLESIISYSTNTGTCSVNTSTGNTAPIVNANPNAIALVIPKGTPFTLTGSGTDANGESVLFNWEQYNLGTTRGGADDAQNSTTSPIFRTFAPTSSGNVRMFPALSSILSGGIASNDEALPQVARTITMRLTGRDNNSSGGGVHCSSVNLTVDNTGPFLITSQNSSTLWFVGGTADIYWSVNGTNAAPLNCVNVKISLSTDGGLTFPTVLTASTPNDGIYSITIPNLLTTQGRIKIEAVGNIFFDINNYSIIIGNTCLSGSSEIIPAASLSAEVGNIALNLGLTGVGAVITSKSGTIANTDPATTLSVFNTNTSSCINFSNPTYYDKYPFIVATAGNYTFTKTSGHYYIIMNLYNGSHNASSPCTNWIGSNANYNGSSVSVNTSITIFLNPGTYNLVITGFNASTPTYPAAYSVSVSPNVYEPIPITPYSYTYVVVKNGTIVAFNASSDLTNTSIYPDGVHTIYGLSFADGTDFSSYVGGAFSTFQTALGNNICGTLSSNTKTVTILNCQQLLPLTNPSDNISSGDIIKQASATNGTITATNFVTGVGTRATYQAKNIQLNAGFKADSGTIFKAEIGGCN